MDVLIYTLHRSKCLSERAFWAKSMPRDIAEHRLCQPRLVHEHAVRSIPRNTPHSMQDDDLSSKAWSGRFSEPVDELVKHYTASVALRPERLAEFDIRGSLAHARMLAQCRRAVGPDLADIERGMAQILARSRPVASPGQWIWRTCTSISSSASPIWSATRASGCTPAARATTRWPPTCGCGCATALDAIDLLIRALQTQLVDLAEQHARHRDARLHPPAGRAAGELRASPDGLLRDAQARPRAAAPTAAGA